MRLICSARLDLGGAPLGTTHRVGAAVSLDEGRRRHGLAATGALSAWPDRAGPYARLDASSDVPLGRHLALGATVGWISADVHPEEELRLGGWSPLVSRQALLEASVPFAGIAPYAVSSELLAVGRGDVTIPLAPGGGVAGAYTIRSLELELGGDIATRSPVPEDQTALLGDLRLGLISRVEHAGERLRVRALWAIPTTQPLTPRAYLSVGFE